MALMVQLLEQPKCLQVVDIVSVDEFCRVISWPSLNREPSFRSSWWDVQIMILSR